MVLKGSTILWPLGGCRILAESRTPSRYREELILVSFRFSRLTSPLALGSSYLSHPMCYRIYSSTFPAPALSITSGRALSVLTDRTHLIFSVSAVVLSRLIITQIPLPIHFDLSVFVGEGWPGSVSQLRRAGFTHSSAYSKPTRWLSGSSSSSSSDGSISASLD